MRGLRWAARPAGSRVSNAGRIADLISDKYRVATLSLTRGLRSGRMLSGVADASGKDRCPDHPLLGALPNGVLPQRWPSWPGNAAATFHTGMTQLVPNSRRHGALPVA